MNNSDFLNGITIYAPVSGKTVKLQDVPDEVFAGLMVGNGLAIEPTSEQLLAPCDGTVINIHPAHHALTIRTKDGFDVLMHIGLDTVTLKGQGFTVLTGIGNNVAKGDALIAFDLAFLSKQAKSTLTEIIVSKASATLDFKQNIGIKVSAGVDVIMQVNEQPLQKQDAKKHAPASDSDSDSPLIHSWDISVKTPDGLHARPAAKLAEQAKKYDADIKLVKANGEAANAKSVTSVMGLNIGQGDKIHLQATGKDAEDALYYLTPLLDDSGDVAFATIPQETVASPVKVKTEPVKVNVDDLSLFQGAPAANGIATGFTYVLQADNIAFDETSDNPAQQIKLLESALSKAEKQLDELYQNISLTPDSRQNAEIFAAHKELLNDPVLVDEVFNTINSGKTAAFAWHKVFSDEANRIGKLDNPLLSARAADLRDIEKRVLLILTNGKKATLRLANNTIILAYELSPSDTAELDKEKITGFATVSGSTTSHSAILARTFGIPCVTGLPDTILNIPDNTMAILDGNGGLLRLSPSQDEIKQAEEQNLAAKESFSSALKDALLPANTKDGKTIEVAGNIGSIEDARLVIANGGDGVGLLRSEFLFMNRDTAPSEAEQSAVYTEIAKIIGKDKKLIIRTLDVGGDKPLSYLPQAREDNPFLGIRGIRLSLQNPDFFRLHIRAILQAAPYCDLHIMFPMISSVDEFLQAKAIVSKEQKKLKITDSIKIGLMIEVPSAAVLTDVFAKEADFFSIGTNDLTQYTLAMDRSNPALNKTADGLHPAVLRLIKMTADNAHKYNRFVGVCGGLAGDEAATGILLGLGIDELSVAPASIPLIKQAVRLLDLKQEAADADKLLGLASAAQIRKQLAENHLQKSKDGA